MSAEETAIEITAQESVDKGRVAFRLVHDTKIYDAPDQSATVLAVLPGGSLITVNEDSGEFLYVITPRDTFGYIDDATPVLPMEWTPVVEQRQAADRASKSALTARAVYAAGALDLPQDEARMTAVRARRAADESWTPEPRTVTAEERVLIYDRIDSNKRSTLVLIAGFVLFMGVFFGAIGAFFGFQSDLAFAEQAQLSVAIGGIAAAIALVVGVVMYFSATRAVLAIAGGREVTKAEEPVLYRIVENLSIGSGLPVPKVWVIEDSAPNAFATGRNPGAAHVAATRGLLDKLEKRELEAVMAHELSHVGNYDTRLMTLMAVAVGLVAMISDMMLRFTRFGVGSRPSNRGKGGGALAIIVIVVALIMIAVAPIAAGIMRLAMSRRREYLADASGALLCRNPSALADALERYRRTGTPSRWRTKPRRICISRIH
jgi:heat shock protein HtpX